MLTSDDAGNPFSTRHTRPGAIRFQFDEGDSETAVVARLRACDWWGQIVGPHGSGKSTLLATLRPGLEAADRQVRLVTLRQGDHALPIMRRDWLAFSTGTQLVVDGYEQLGRFARRLAMWRCRRRGCGLLVTTHHDIGLPTLFTTAPRLEVAITVVRQLLPPGEWPIDSSDIAAAWQRYHGNMREVLFALYDLFEQRRGAGRNCDDNALGCPSF
jgi:hypothetical protein